MKRVISLVAVILLAVLAFVAGNFLAPKLLPIVDEWRGVTVEPAKTNAPNDDGRTISVSGSATIYMDADTAVVSLGVTEMAEEVTAAQSAMNEKIAAIRAALLEIGVPNDQINTNRISINPRYEYDYETGKQTMVGYTASNTLSVYTDKIDLAGKVIDAAFAAGANTLNNVEFKVADSNEQALTALGNAVRNARAQAEALAAAEGLKVGEAKVISQGYSSTYDASNSYDMVVKAAGLRAEATPAPTDLQSAKIAVSASVSVVFELTK